MGQLLDRLNGGVNPPSFSGRTDNAMLATSLESWAVSAAWTRDAFVDLARAKARSPPAYPGENVIGNGSINMSLGFAGGGVPIFVHWLNFHTRGQRVHLYENSKFIYSTPSFRPVEEFTGAHVWNPDIGLKMPKVRRPWRPDCPQHILRQREIMQQMSGVCNPVVACEHCGGVAPRRLDVSKQCGSCLLYWHRDCAELVRSLPSYSLCAAPCPVWRVAT